MGYRDSYPSWHKRGRDRPAPPGMDWNQNYENGIEYDQEYLVSRTSFDNESRICSSPKCFHERFEFENDPSETHRDTFGNELKDFSPDRWSMFTIFKEKLEDNESWCLVSININTKRRYKSKHFCHVKIRKTEYTWKAFTGFPNCLTVTFLPSLWLSMIRKFLQYAFHVTLKRSYVEKLDTRFTLSLSCPKWNCLQDTHSRIHETALWPTDSEYPIEWRSQTKATSIGRESTHDTAFLKMSTPLLAWGIWSHPPKKWLSIHRWTRYSQTNNHSNSSLCQYLAEVFSETEKFCWR